MRLFMVSSSSFAFIDVVLLVFLCPLTHYFVPILTLFPMEWLEVLLLKQLARGQKKLGYWPKYEKRKFRCFTTYKKNLFERKCLI